MAFEIILFAVIAVVLLARLWSVFGRRGDDEPQRPNPFVIPAPGPQDSNKSTVASDGQATPPRLPPLLQPFHAPPSSLAGGLEQITALDPSFDEKVFLQGARTAFTNIVEDFAKGDLGATAKLLGPNVLPHFQKAIEARRAAGQSMEGKVHRIREAETTAARVDDGKALIAVRFVSEQENTLRDAGGKVLGGDPGKLEEIVDLWTFQRDPKSGDPNWILIETRS